VIYLMLVKNITINGLNKIINEKLCKLKAVNSLLEVQYDLKAKLFACYHRRDTEVHKGGGPILAAHKFEQLVFLELVTHRWRSYRCFRGIFSSCKYYRKYRFKPICKYMGYSSNKLTRPKGI